MRGRPFVNWSARYYSADYEGERNKLIPEAEAFANQKFGKSAPRTDKGMYDIRWSKTFFAQMDKLWKERSKDNGDQKGN